MANIRKQFTENKNLTGYKKKKYVCKIIYLYMLGYDVDFGHVEAINLLSSSKFSEKQVVNPSPTSAYYVAFAHPFCPKGYLFLGVLLNEEHQLVPLVIQSISHDLAGVPPSPNITACLLWVCLFAL
jgi:AP-2 complex subunit alpha